MAHGENVERSKLENLIARCDELLLVLRVADEIELDPLRQEIEGLRARLIAEYALRSSDLRASA